MTDDEFTLLLALLKRPRSRLKAYARMRKRDRLFAAWSTLPPSLPLLTKAIEFGLEEPLLEADTDERELLAIWWHETAAYTARELFPAYLQLADASQLARDDMLVRLSTRATIEVFGLFGLVTLWEWVTQRDARVCDECGPLDGRVMDSSSIAPLPMHPRCRCGLRPVVRELPALVSAR